MEKNKETIELNDQEFLIKISEAGLEKNLKSYLQKEGDRRLSEGLKTYQKNQEKKDFSDSEKITNLENELKEMKDNTAKNSLNNSIKASLKEAGLNEGFAKYIKIDNNDQSKVAEAVEELKLDLLNAKQAENDLKLKEGEIPPKGDGTSAGSGMETAVKEYAKKISPKE